MTSTINVKNNRNSIIIIALFVFSAILLIGIFLVRAFQPYPSSHGNLSGTVTPQVSSPVQPSPSTNAQPTQPDTSASNSLVKTAILKNPANKTLFEYSFEIPVDATLSAGEYRMVIEFKNGGYIAISQIGQGYVYHFTSYEKLQGKSGTYYRVKAEDLGNETSYYPATVRASGSCDPSHKAPCGTVYTSSFKGKSLSLVACNGAPVAECDAVMKTVVLKKK